MTFCDIVDQQLLDAGLASRRGVVPLPVEVLHPKVSDCVLAAATRLTARISQQMPQVGFEVDVATDYDAASGQFVSEVYVSMQGRPPYGASVVLLAQGFEYRAQEEIFYVNVTQDASRLGTPL